MFTEDEKAQILAMVDKQTKYKTKKELLIAIRDYLTKNMNNQNAYQNEVKHSR